MEKDDVPKGDSEQSENTALVNTLPSRNNKTVIWLHASEKQTIAHEISRYVRPHK